MALKPIGGEITSQDINDNFSFLDSKIAEKVITTSIETTSYYVSPTGNDDNIGTQNLPFKTLQKAVSMLPDVIKEGHIYTIYLTVGEWNEELRLEHLTIHGELVVQGTTDIRENHKVHRVRGNTLIGHTTIKNIVTTVKTANGASFWFERCAPHVDVNNVKSESDPEVEYGVEGAIGLLADFGSHVYVTNSDFGGKRYGIRSNYLSRIYSKNNTGDGNTFGVGARWGGIVSVHGSQPRGSTDLTTDSGGIIGKDYGAIVGYNHEEKGLVETIGQRESIKRYLFTSTTFGLQSALPSGKQLRIRMKRNIDGVHFFNVKYGGQTASTNAQFGDCLIGALITGNSVNTSLTRSARGVYLNFPDNSIFLQDGDKDGEFDLIVKAGGALSGRFAIDLEMTVHRNSSAPTVLDVFVE